MGATLSEYVSGKAEKSPDCVIGGYQYRIDGTFFSAIFAVLVTVSEFDYWRRERCGQKHPVSPLAEDLFRREKGGIRSALLDDHTLEESVQRRNG